MKRVVKIVFLLGFLVVAFIFSWPWLLFWAMPMTEPNSDFEAKFYVYDVRKGTKTLVYSHKGLKDVYPLYFDDRNSSAYFIRGIGLGYMIPELHVDVRRDAGALAYIDLKTKKMKKFWKFFADKEFSVPCCYSPFMDGRFHFVRTIDHKGVLFRLNENGKEEQVAQFPFKYDPGGDSLLPAGENTFLLSRTEVDGEKNAVTMIAKIKNDKMDVLARHSGQGGLIYGTNSIDSKGERTTIGYVVRTCLKFPSTGCELHHYVYHVRTGKTKETVKILLPDKKVFWFSGVKNKDEIILNEFEKGALRLFSYNVLTKKLTPYFSLPYPLYSHAIQNGKGDNVTAMILERKLEKPIVKHSLGTGYGYDNATDLYLLDQKKGKLIPVDKGVILTSPSVAWNDAGDKMLYVVIN